MSNYSKEPRLILEKVLKAKGMSKYEFSKRLGVATSNSAKYFKKDFNPTLKTLTKWSKILGCKISDLIEE